MGNSCDAFTTEIDTSNICNDHLDQAYSSRGFCTLAGSHNDYRVEYCEALSDGEWVRVSSGEGTCHYNSCDERTEVTTSAGCCNGSCCSIVGKNAVCKRIAFKGDPLSCCFRDLTCNSSSTNEYCFSDSSKKRTCSPEFRDKSSESCQDLLYEYCTAPDVNDNIFYSRWLGTGIVIEGQHYDQPCYHALYRNLYKNQAGACLEQAGVGYPNSQGFKWSQDLMTGVFKRYISSGNSLDSRPGEQTNIEFNAMLWDICSDTPGLCQPGLNTYCTSVTVDTLIRRPGLSPWCSCYLPDEQYSKYTNLYQINKECTPICNTTGALPLADESGTSTKICQQSICIIDDISISLAESKVGIDSPINFTQLCGSCGEGTCSCVISNNTIAIINSESSYIEISQNCSSSNSTCYSEVIYPDGSVVPVEINCNSDSLNTNNPYADIEQQNAYNQQTAYNRRNWFVLILFILVVVFMVIIWWVVSPPPSINEVMTVPLIPINY